MLRAARAPVGASTTPDTSRHDGCAFALPTPCRFRQRARHGCYPLRDRSSPQSTAAPHVPPADSHRPCTGHNAGDSRRACEFPARSAFALEPSSQHTAIWRGIARCDAKRERIIDEARMMRDAEAVWHHRRRSSQTLHAGGVEARAILQPLHSPDTGVAKCICDKWCKLAITTTACASAVDFDSLQISLCNSIAIQECERVADIFCKRSCKEDRL